MPTPTFVGASTAQANPGASVSISIPAGVAAGDLLLITYFVSYADALVTPSGWTVLRDSDTGLGNPISRGVIYYKIAGASEPTSVTLGDPAGYEWRHHSAVWSAYRGVDPTTPINAEGWRGGINYNHEAQSIDTTKPSCRVVAWYAIDYSEAEWLVPSGASARGAVTNQPAHYSVDFEQATAGATGIQHAGFADVSNTAMCHGQIALAPAPTARPRMIVG